MALPPFHPAARRVAEARARRHLEGAERLFGEARGEPVSLVASIVDAAGEVVATERTALSLADRVAAGRLPDPEDAITERDLHTWVIVAGGVGTALGALFAHFVGFSW